MNIECVGEKIIEAVGKVEKIVGKNLTLPILGCILFEAKNKALFLKATNLDLGIEMRLPVKISTEGSVAVPGGILNSYLSHIDSRQNLSLEVVDGNLKINSSHGSTIIKSMGAEDFPTIPRIDDGKPFSIPTKDFLQGIKAVWYSSALSNMKPELSSIYIHHDDGQLFFVATDSFRLAEKKVKTKNLKDMNQILIPVKNIPEIIRVLEGCSGDIDVVFNKNQIAFSHQDVYLTSRIIDGVFPDYNQIIPKEHKNHSVLLKQDAINALKVATVFSDKFNKLNIKSRKGDKMFELSTRNADVGESVVSLDAVVEGEDVDMNFNYRYIADCFQSIEADSVSFDFNGPTKPLVIKGIRDDSFTYIVMPINK